jgi:hypothetical protein
MNSPHALMDFLSADQKWPASRDVSSQQEVLHEDEVVVAELGEGLWKGQTADSSFAVELQASVLRTLDCYCRKAGSSETGGILIGRYSDDPSPAIVLEATPPPSSLSWADWQEKAAPGRREPS